MCILYWPPHRLIQIYLGKIQNFFLLKLLLGSTKRRLASLLSHRLIQIYLAAQGFNVFKFQKKKCTNTILRGLNKTCSNKTCLNKTCSNKTCLDKTCSNKTCSNKTCLNKTCLNLVPTEGVLGFRGIETLLNHEKCFLFYKKHFSLNVF